MNHGILFIVLNRRTLSKHRLTQNLKNHLQEGSAVQRISEDLGGVLYQTNWIHREKPLEG